MKETDTEQNKTKMDEMQNKREVLDKISKGYTSIFRKPELNRDRVWEGSIRHRGESSISNGVKRKANVL